MGGKHKQGVCVVPECGMQPKIVGRGLCRKHYEEFRADGSLNDFDRRILPPMFDGDRKVCGTCSLELPMSDFKANGTKLNPNRRQSVCKKCQYVQHKKTRDARKSRGVCVFCESPVTNGSNKCDFHIRERARWRSTVHVRVTELLTSTRLRAEDKGVIFSLDAEWVRTRLEMVCELTGLPFDLEPGRRIGRFNPYAPSIDRRIPGGNYTPDNCRMIVMALNVGINYWGEDIYRHIAKAYLKQRKTKKSAIANSIPETYNLLLENPQSIRTRKH
jgi:hypothetical protein